MYHDEGLDWTTTGQLMDKTKLYCYVDENGQDTKGRIFIVSVVIIEEKRDELLKFCEEVEEETRKGKTKWRKSEYGDILEYLRKIFRNKDLASSFIYSVYENTKGYDVATILGIAKAINVSKPVEDFTSVVYVDGLSKTKRHEYSSELRKLGIPTAKVQGVAKDENNSLIRLADSLAGFIRDVLDGDRREARKLFDRVVKSGVLVEV